MALSSLLVCADESTAQMLRRILEGLGITVEHCQSGSEAQLQLAKTRFDSLVIDGENESEATELLRKARSSSLNQPTLAVAIVGKENNVRYMFALGVNFVLYKPVSEERAWSSFRAARSLMQRERRRSTRVSITADAALDYANVENVPATLVDLSEHGTAVESQRKLPPDCRIYFKFALPGHTSLIRLSGEVAWQDSGMARLRASLGNRRGQSRHACRLGADVYRRGIPVPHRCSLSDISSGGCYVEMPTPFPAGTRVEIIVRTQDMKLRTQGVVQSRHPGFGMGVQLMLKTAGDHDQVQSLIRLLEQSGEEEVGPA